VLYIFISVLDPSSPSSHPRVTEALNGLPFILARQRNSRTFDWQRAKIQPGVLKFGMSVTDIQFVGICKPNLVNCRFTWISKN